MVDLIARNVSVSYGRTPVLTSLNLTARAGSVYGLLGLNGAGKSTLFNAILGLIPYDGTISLGDHPVDLALVGASVNGPAFYPQLTARRNLLIHALLTGTDPARIDEVLNLVGLDARGRKAGKFSTGMKVRLSVAMALLTDPPVLILDEPQNGLDPQGTKDLRNLMRRLAAAGKTVVVSSHQLGEMTKVLDQVGILAEGHLVYEGPLESLIDHGDTLEDAFFRLTRGGAVA